MQRDCLVLWHAAITSSVRSDAPDLTSRQMAIMLAIYFSHRPATVRGLARELHISKPAVSRALDRLGELKYIKRIRDDIDRRNVMTQITAEGTGFLAQFSQLILEAKSLAHMPESQ